MTNLENVPPEGDFRSEERPDMFRVEVRKPAGGKGTAEGRYRQRRAEGGNAEKEQEEAEKEEPRGHCGTARPRGETKEEPEKEG